MRAVRPEILDLRRRTGADRWDGELHMPPTPSIEHQDFSLSLPEWLRAQWKPRRQGNEVHPPINVASRGGWPKDYRIPDVVLVTHGSQGVDRGEYYEGPPTVVIEVRSPGDESYEKLSFYAKIGVPEVWIIDRDTKMPEVYVLDGGGYEKQQAGEGDWLSSAATGVELRRADEKLAVRMAADPQTERLLPED